MIEQLFETQRQQNEAAERRAVERQNTFMQNVEERFGTNAIPKFKPGATVC